MDSKSSHLLRTIGTNIRSLRENRNFTQVELAKKAGMNSNHFSKIERGEVNTSSVKVKNIIDALGVRASDILPF
jgi:transcriptional regulator with XRE-family HTH domain